MAQSYGNRLRLTVHVCAYSVCVRGVTIYQY